LRLYTGAYRQQTQNCNCDDLDEAAGVNHKILLIAISAIKTGFFRQFVIQNELNCL